MLVVISSLQKKKIDISQNIYFYSTKVIFFLAFDFHSEISHTAVNLLTYVFPYVHSSLQSFPLKLKIKLEGC